MAENTYYNRMEENAGTADYYGEPVNHLFDYLDSLCKHDEEGWNEISGELSCSKCDKLHYVC